MKTLITGAILLAMASTVSAGHYDDDPELAQSILNDHSSGSVSSVVRPGENDDYASVFFYGMDADQKECPLQKGEGDEYGSVLLDV